MSATSKSIAPAPLVIVAGLAKETRAIGRENGLLWHVPDDLKRFKQLTLGHPVIFGRKTFESILDILGKPLPNRTNIVVSRNPEYSYPGVTVVPSLTDAIAAAQIEDPTEIHIGGGEQLYRQALPYTSRLHLTFFHDDKEGDAFFPDFTEDFVETERHGLREHNGLTYEWVDYERRD